MSYYYSPKDRKRAQEDAMKIVVLTATGILAVIIVILSVRTAHFGQRVVSIAERRRADKASDYAYTEIKEYFARKVEEKTGRKPEKMALWVGSPSVGYYVISVYYRYHRVWYCFRIENGHKWMTPEIEAWAKGIIHY